MFHNASPKILIADNFPIVRYGLKQILAKEISGAVFGEATDCREMLRFVRQEHWDLVVLEICRSGKSGLDAIKQMKSIRPDMPILVLTMYPEDQFAERTLMCGADGYLNKESTPDDLICAVKQVLQGGTYISKSWAEQWVSKLTRGLHKTPHERLSDREYEVMIMTAAGKTLSEIAEELSLSVKTVSTYRTRTLHKMRMKTNADLIRYAIREELSV